jgi:aspartyl-tRNA synthetase
LLKRTHTCGEVSEELIGKEVVLNGWVDRIRDLGGIKFILIRDRYGKTQVFFDPEKNKDLYEKALKLNLEYTVSIKGTVNKRPGDAINENMKTGTVEILATELEILSKSEIPPIYVNREDEISENLRLKYRFLDLRKEKMQRNLLIRHKVIQATRNFLSNLSFLEIETPYLGKSTPEGARDFIVPSRLKKGNFYALPQSPQIFKQLLMVSGFDRYFQFARCFRDEDFRADRQPEFTQIDLEASFVDKEDILIIVENMIKHIFKDVLNYEVNESFKRYTHAEVMDKFGSDKPDTRYGMELIDITEYFKDTQANFLKSVIENNGVLKGFIIKNKASEYSRKKYDDLTNTAKEFGATGLIWISKNNDDVKSSIKKLAEKELNNLIKDGIIDNEDVMLIIAGDKNSVNKTLGQLRTSLIRELNEKPLKEFEFLWVVDFPMFAFDEEENRIQAEHHPFTMPIIEDLKKYENEPLKICSESYDLVINGYEMASGSVRIHDQEIQRKVFEIIGLDVNEINDKFGFLIDAFKFGPPPHAGAALGLDRIVAVMAGETSIKEVIAFPKTATGSDLLSGAPANVEKEQLEILNLQNIEKRGN